MGYKVVEPDKHSVVVPEEHLGDSVAESVDALTHSLKKAQKQNEQKADELTKAMSGVSDSILKIAALKDAIEKVSESISNRNVAYEFNIIRGNNGLISAIHASPMK